MSNKQFRTIAGRWKDHVQAAGLEELQTRDMLLFYAGFAAALDATMELAEHDDLRAMRILSSLHSEAKAIAATAAAVIASSSKGTH